MNTHQIPNVRVLLQGQAYVEAAEILLDYNRVQPAAVMAALAIEVFMKSFLAENNLAGRAISKRGHDISSLFEQIKPEIRSALLDCSNELDQSINFVDELRKHDRVFMSARYFYEPDAVASVGSDIVYIARHISECVHLLAKTRSVIR